MEVKSIGKNNPVSTKQAIAICKFIRGRTVEQAISVLEKVRMKKVAVPVEMEVGHKKGEGMERGKYPIKASAYFIKLLKNLKGNAIVKNLEVESTVVKLAIANKGEKGVRSGRRGRGTKRTHIYLIGEGKIGEVKVKQKVKPKKEETKPESKEEVKTKEVEEEKVSEKDNAQEKKSEEVKKND